MNSDQTLEIPILQTPRLHLQPIKSSHAEEMFFLLSDAELYHFTGGNPPDSVASLRDRYEFLRRGLSPDGSEHWLNWVLLLKEGGVVGYVQATVTEVLIRVAWVVGAHWQGQGFASEAAKTMVQWLETNYQKPITARIHPRHLASQQVAARVGLTATSEMVDGEVVWRKNRAWD